MSVITNPVDVRDYLRVVFSRGWWFLFVTLFVLGGMFVYTFFMADRLYEATNEIGVTDKYSGSLSKDIGRNPDWVGPVQNAVEQFKRPVPAREIITDAAAAVGMSLSEEDVARRVAGFKKDLSVNYSKKGDYIELSYRSDNGKLSAAVLSLFMKRLINHCVTAQVQKLNTEVNTLMAMRGKLAAEVAAAERRLDRMKTIPPELRLTADTMALLQTGRDLSTLPSTEQAIRVFLELQKDIIGLDAEIADTAERIQAIRAEIEAEPETVPERRKLEALPAVREALERRDSLRLQLSELLANSTVAHPMVKQLQTQLRSIDAFLQAAATQSNVEITFEKNRRRAELSELAAALERDLDGLQKRRAKMEENAASWHEKLDRMPAQLREIREASLEYEKKAQNLSMITDRLVQAQIKRSLELDQVATYYQPEWELTQIPSTYRKPPHLVHMVLGLVLGLIASVFVVYAMEFADHSVKDQRDLKLYTKTAVLGVISDYNQLKSVAKRAARARVRTVKTWALTLLFAALLAGLGWALWKFWPRPDGNEILPQSLSASAAITVSDAMSMYAAEGANLADYSFEPEPDIDVAPAVVTPQEEPGPVLSQ